MRRRHDGYYPRAGSVPLQLSRGSVIQRKALREYTEAPIRQAGWKARGRGVIGGLVLGGNPGLTPQLPTIVAVPPSIPPMYCKTSSMGLASALVLLPA